METNGLKSILKRVEGWSQTAQQEAFNSLRAIEEDFADLGSNHDLEESRSQAHRGEGVSLVQLKEELDL